MPPTPQPDPSPQPLWRPRDLLAAAALFLATAAVVLWQNAHVAVLWDLSYVLDTATRISQGQIPYRDFPLAHAPLTFLIQAAIVRLSGRVFFHHVLYAAIIGGLATVLAWRIVLHTLRPRLATAWPVALILAAPLTVLGIYSILPHPSYDCDCAFSILAAITLLQRLPAAPTLPRALATGAALCPPVFFKQNIGLPFLAASVAAILVLLIAALFRRGDIQASKREALALSAVLAGAAATLLAAALLIHFTAGLANYIHWTFQFAAQRRMPGLASMLAVYREPTLLWALPSIAAALILLWIRPSITSIVPHPFRRFYREMGGKPAHNSRAGSIGSPLIRARWAQVAALLLLAAPFLFALGSLVLYDDADERGDSLLALWPLLLILSAALALFAIVRFRRRLTLPALLPIVLLVTINGALLSQQLWGSTYAIWPLLLILIAELIAFPAALNLTGLFPAVFRALAPFLAGLIAATLLVCGGFYIASEERLSYADIPCSPPLHSAFPQLAGLSVPGPYLPNLDELLRYAAATIPSSDGILLLPGEDPFYFATGRAPRFPVLLFDPATDPLSPDQVVAQARAHSIRWLIVKRELQIKENPTPQPQATLAALLQDFTLSTRLHGYDIYRRTGEVNHAGR